MPDQRQPLLHDLVTVLSAPVQAWSGRDGQIRRHGIQGVYLGDVRVLSSAVLSVNGEEPEPLALEIHSAHAGVELGLTASYVVRSAGIPGDDPLLLLRRARSARADGMSETLTFASSHDEPLLLDVVLDLEADLAGMETVKSGVPAATAAPAYAAGAWGWTEESGARVAIEAPDAEIGTFGGGLRLQWTVKVPAAGEHRVEWALRGGDISAPMAAAAQVDGGVEWSLPSVATEDRRVGRLLQQSLSDLAGLRMASASHPEDTFLAAGAPWFFTLFGRDSLLAARMMLPLGAELAAGTLRSLAARQGRAVDAATAEQPGKILHEVRRSAFVLEGAGLSLPPVYFGTIDATPLWICLLHDAWRWGMPEAEVEALLDSCEAALAWMRDYGDSDGDGFLEYLDESGVALANQGWKDSPDSVRWRDGSVAEGPIALCEVQAYAYEAAVSGAALLEAFGRPGAEEWRAWAAALADRFRAAFWVQDDRGPYPAIALDAHKRPVDGVSSNMGHLLGTGILNAAESAAVADRLMHPTLFSGYGIRTLSTDNGAYSPLRYHCGAVWTHDSAIILAGLAREGHHGHAARLSRALLDAAEGFDFRLPELFSGHDAGDVAAPLPYPASCRPQAWAASSAVPVVVAALGMVPDARHRSIRLAGIEEHPFGDLRIDGLRLGAEPFTVTVDDGETRCASASGLRFYRR